MMDEILLVQLGTGGMAWLVFVTGLLWCGFAWWRATRCRRALVSVIAAIASMVCGLLLIMILITASMRLMGTGPGSSSQMIESIALGLLLLTALSWAVSAFAFLLASSQSIYPNPEDLAPPEPKPQ